MSGRPRTTSFAESCKPVPQPSAFGSMKVSSEYRHVILHSSTPEYIWYESAPVAEIKECVLLLTTLNRESTALDSTRLVISMSPTEIRRR